MPLEVTRSKGRGRIATLSVAVDGQPLGNGMGTSHTSAETKAELLKRIGVSYDALLAGPFLLQRTKNLMDELPSKRKALLLDLLLDQGQYPEWAEIAKSRVARAKAVIDTNATQLARLSAANLPALREMFEQKVATAREDIRNHDLSVKVSQTELDEAVERLADVRARAARVTEVGAMLDDARKAFLAAKQKHTDAQASVTAAEATLKVVKGQPFAIVSEDYVNAAIEEAATARAEHLRWKSEKDHAQAIIDAARQQKPVTCPKCGETFTPGVDAEAVAQAESALAFVEQTIGLAQQNALDLAGVSTRARAGRSDWLAWDQRHNDARKALERAQGAVAESLAALTPLADQGRKLKAEHESLQGEAEKLIAAEADVERERGIRDRAAERLADATRDLHDAERGLIDVGRDEETQTRLVAETEAAQKDAEVFGVLRDAFSRDGIPTMKLEAALPVIEDHANGVLARMPGGFSLRLVTQKATAKGTASDTLEVVVDPGTGQPRSYAMLSGGQQFRVDLAIRLGITSVLSDRHIDTMVVDEGFDRWQDDAGRTAVLDTLAAIADDFARILVISHHPDTIERLERMGAHRIEVQQDLQGVAHATAA